MFGIVIHRYIYLLGLALMAISLPLSPFFLSLGQFIIVGNWLVELKFKQKWKLIKENPAILLFAGIFIIHVIWLINTENIDYALHDIKIKLPLLALPILLGTSAPLNLKEYKLIIHLFIGAIISSTLISAGVYLGIGGMEIVDSRDISLFISHIRFALMLNLSIFIILSIILTERHLKIANTYVYSIVLVWLLIYQISFGAFSGVAIFFLTLPTVGLLWIFKQQNVLLRKIGFLIIISATVITVSYPIVSTYRFLNRNEVNWDTLPKQTINGNAYIHYKTLSVYENKTLVWILVSTEELAKEWNKRSYIHFTGKDEKGQNLKSTLIRYLASLDYTKDSVGVSLLTKEDIRMIEKGYTNHLQKQKWLLYPRFYELLWEIEHYINHGNPSGHSLSLRFEFMKNGLQVIKQNFWFGTGTGDINDEILLQYEKSQSKLKENWQFRPHNQFITFFATFGIIGFTILVVVFSLGLYLRRHLIDITTIALLSILLLSMLTEDTLETQAGATFFAFFISLVLLARSKELISNKSTRANSDK